MRFLSVDDLFRSKSKVCGFRMQPFFYVLSSSTVIKKKNVVLIYILYYINKINNILHYNLVKQSHLNKKNNVHNTIRMVPLFARLDRVNYLLKYNYYIYNTFLAPTQERITNRLFKCFRYQEVYENTLVWRIIDH